MLKRSEENDKTPLTPAQQEAVDDAVRHMEANGPEPGWSRELIRNRQRVPTPNLANAITLFRKHPAWFDVLYFDEFAQVVRVRHAPPWEGSGIADRKWTAHDDPLAANWLQHLGVNVETGTAAQAVEVVARDATFHPVRDMLNSLQWDGEERIATWLTVYFGVGPSGYVTEIGKNFLISAVARIIAPGCKADAMLILEGPQGIGKSRAARILAHPHFSDELADIGSKDAAMQLAGVWLIEFSELGALHRSEVTRLKAFLSCTTDRFRPPYGRRVIEVPRQCVFLGTTNDEEYLKDETGARRFWPVKVRRIDLAALERDRDQLWAEAVELYKQGTQWWINSSDLAAAAKSEQDKRYIADPWDEAIAAYVKDLDDTSVAEIMEDVFHIDKSHQDRGTSTRVGRAMAYLGFEQYQTSSGKRGRRYRRRTL
jgi:predicted P-loop ATPase